jgi:hypothetical protein
VGVTVGVGVGEGLRRATAWTAERVADGDGDPAVGLLHAVRRTAAAASSAAAPPARARTSAPPGPVAGQSAVV